MVIFDQQEMKGVIMPAINRAANERSSDQAVVSRKVQSYANDPYFVKKAEEEAKATLKKFGLPGQKKK